MLLAGATAVVACGSATTSINPFSIDGGGSGAGVSSGGSASGSGGTASSGGASSGGSGGTSSSGASSGGGDGGTTTGAPVLEFHKNPSRDGLYVDPLMTKANVAAFKLDTTFAPTITGNVYAQPLYVTNGPGGQAAYIVATESNHVTAIDVTGKVLWDQSYGTPVNSGLPCGDITPLGITGTPVIDASSRTVYFDAMTNNGGTPTHMIHAVSLDNGAELAGGWPVNVDMHVTGFTSNTQNQRGALALLNGVVYVPYGGLDGDCGSYLGYVLGIPVATPTAVTVFGVGGMFPSGSTAAANATAGGIWAGGGVARDDSSLYVSTGNTMSAAASHAAPAVWCGGEAVLRLAPGPVFTNSSANEFYPTNWAMLDRTDEDLGGSNPIVFDMTGADGGTMHLIAAPGKDGFLYVVDRDNLGGMGGQLSMTAVGPQGTGGPGALTAAGAAYTTGKGTYVAYRINTGPGVGCAAGTGAARGSIGVARITGNPPTAQVVWCSAESSMGSPIVTSSGSGDVIVWDANTHLFGYDGDTGAKVYSGTDTMASSMHYYATPIETGGRVAVATSGPGHLYVFHR